LKDKGYAGSVTFAITPLEEFDPIITVYAAPLAKSPF
jgi:hypothetical protein